jgi:hypothetical protein
MPARRISGRARCLPPLLLSAIGPLEFGAEISLIAAPAA